MGVSYYVVATSLIGLVGDYLFDDRKQQDRVSTSRLAEELAPLYLSAQTQTLQERLEAHRSGKGAKYTRGRLPLKLKYREGCGTHSDALKRELEIKHLSREEKLALIGETE